MPTLEKLPSGKWRAKIFVGRDENGKQIFRSVTAETKKQAKYKADEIVFEAQRKEQPLNITVGEAIDKYIALKSNILSPSTIKAYKSVRRNNLKSLMDIPLFRLTRDKIQQAVNIDAVSHSDKTVKNAHGLLSAALGVYHSDFVIKTTMPKKKHKEKYIPSTEDVSRLLQLTEGTNMYIPILLAATLSLRRSEVCALSWDDVDFVSNKVTIRHGKVQNDKNEWVIKDPKTYTSHRTLAMPPILASKLKETKKEGKYITNLTPGALSCKFFKIIKHNDFKKFTFHALRHYNASVMLALNLPDKYAMERGGWSTAAVMKNIYQHTFGSEQDHYDKILADYFDILGRNKFPQSFHTN